MKIAYRLVLVGILQSSVLLAIPEGQLWKRETYMARNSTKELYRSLVPANPNAQHHGQFADLQANQKRPRGVVLRRRVPIGKLSLHRPMLPHEPVVVHRPAAGSQSSLPPRFSEHAASGPGSAKGETLLYDSLTNQEYVQMDKAVGSSLLQAQLKAYELLKSHINQPKPNSHGIPRQLYSTSLQTRPIYGDDPDNANPVFQKENKDVSDIANTVGVANPLPRQARKQAEPIFEGQPTRPSFQAPEITLRTLSASPLWVEVPTKFVSHTPAYIPVPAVPTSHKAASTKQASLLVDTKLGQVKFPPPIGNRLISPVLDRPNLPVRLSSPLNQIDLNRIPLSGTFENPPIRQLSPTQSRPEIQTSLSLQRQLPTPIATETHGPVSKKRPESSSSNLVSELLGRISGFPSIGLPLANLPPIVPVITPFPV